jgi:hypothetical protein
VTKRLEVLLDDEELREFQRLARRRGMTTAEWVRSSLRQARDAEGGADATQKLAVIRRADRHEFPTGDIEQLLEETGRGYLAGSEDVPPA